MPSRSFIVGQLRRVSFEDEELMSRLVEVDSKDTLRAAADEVLIWLSPMSEPQLTKAAAREEEATGGRLNTDALAIVVEARSAAALAIFMLESDTSFSGEAKYKAACG